MPTTATESSKLSWETVTATFRSPQMHKWVVTPIFRRTFSRYAAPSSTLEPTREATSPSTTMFWVNISTKSIPIDSRKIKLWYNRFPWSRVLSIARRLLSAIIRPRLSIKNSWTCVNIESSIWATRRNFKTSEDSAKKCNPLSILKWMREAGLWPLSHQGHTTIDLICSTKTPRSRDKNKIKEFTTPNWPPKRRMDNTHISQRSMMPRTIPSLLNLCHWIKREEWAKEAANSIRDGKEDRQKTQEISSTNNKETNWLSSLR